MAEYLVIFRTVVTSGFNRALITRLNKIGGQQFMSSPAHGVWLINTPLSAAGLANRLYPPIKAEGAVYGQRGKLMIVKVNSPADLKTWGMGVEWEAWAARRAPLPSDAAKAATR